MHSFIYFIDLDNPLVCMNLINTNQVISPSLAHYETYKTKFPLYEKDLDNILLDIDSISIGFASPRFQYIILSRWARDGLKIGIGAANTKFYTDCKVERIHRIANLEIEFEKIRREIDSNLPSRLSCIYVAEDNIGGRIMLRNMFYNKRNFHIAQVNIAALKLHKADSKWISAYEEKQNKCFIENYWRGLNFDKNPQYEYLVEGIVYLKNEHDREAVKLGFDSTPYYS